MRKLCFLLFLAVAVSVLYADSDLPTATASPIWAEAIGAGEIRALSPADLCYDPSWAAMTNITGGRVILRCVEHPDTEQAVTSVVNTCAVDAAGVYTWVLPVASERNVRLLHATEIDGTPFGETLTADVVFGKQSSASAPFFAASATNALQLIADAKGVAPLAYSTDWTNGVASVRIDYAYEKWKCGKSCGSGAGTLTTAAAPATGVFNYDLGGIPGGDYTLTYTMLGANDEVLGTYTSLFSLPVKLGMILMFR